MAEPMTTPIPDQVISADISDGDFRTYALLCQLAWRTHPNAERPYTELGYEKLAKLHPGNSLTASAIRARIQRLVQAGLLVRERLDNVRWRTYPAFSTANSTGLGASWDNSQSYSIEMGDMADLTQGCKPELAAIPHSTQVEEQNGWVPSHVTPNGQQPSLGAMADSTQTDLSEMGAIPHDTQVTYRDLWVLAHVALNCQQPSLGAMVESTHTNLSEMGATWDGTQSCKPELGASPHHTQVKSQDSWVLSQVTPNCQQSNLGASPANTHTGLSEMGAMPDLDQSGKPELAASPHNTQAASDLTDLIDPDQDQINQSDQGGVGGIDLRQALCSLSPEPMSEEGVLECLHQPELTAAWLAYIHDPLNRVKNPAAYLRRQVQRGKYPPLQADHRGSGTSQRRLDERTRPFVTQPLPAARFAFAASSLAVATLPATRWPLDAS